MTAKRGAAKPKRGRGSAARMQEALLAYGASEGASLSSSAPQRDEPPILCPSCHCTLPDANHLVSSSMIDELRAVARARHSGAA